MPMKQRRKMIEPHLKLSMRRQCELLAVNRSSLYYQPVEPDPDELALMRVIDELHLEFPFYGSRKITEVLKAKGHAVNRKRVQRLMRLMDLEAIAPKPNTSRKAKDHPVFPYLLRNLKVSRVNQVWAADISVPQKAAREMRDRPLAIGLQEQVANHRKRLGSKALVVSVAEKAP